MCVFVSVRFCFRKRWLTHIHTQVPVDNMISRTKRVSSDKRKHTCYSVRQGKRICFVENEVMPYEHCSYESFFVLLLELGFASSKDVLICCLV